MNIWKKTVSLIMVLSMMLAIAVIPSSAAGTQKGSMYPTVFVHGMMGWGEGDDGLANAVDYWGLASGSMVNYLSRKGYNVVEAAVGPLCSNWDRACELYAQLTGTRVDYGAYHAKKYGHERYGEDYTGKSILGNYKWNGTNKLNMVGHSMGGPTIRFLADFLKDGDAQEVSYAKSNGLSVSPLFTGGKGDRIFSITCIASPLNGTTYKEALPINYNGSIQIYALWAKYLFSNNLLNKVLDFNLDHFGIGQQPNELFAQAFLRVLGHTDFLQHNDNCINDMGVDRNCALNKKLDQSSNIFYFSYPMTCVDKVGGAWIPDVTAFPLLQAYALKMAYFTGTTEGYYEDGYGSYYKKVAVKKQTLGPEWQENDGFTNVYGDAVPFHLNAAGSRVFDRSINATMAQRNFKPGYWYVLPAQKFDHFGAVGGLFTENTSQVQQFYLGIMQRIYACTK